MQYVTTRENAGDGDNRVPEEDIALRNLSAIDSAADDMNAVAARRHGRCKDPAFHATISWADGENPTREEMFLAADELLRVLGMEESQAVYSIHRDTDNLHIHIAASRISMRDFRAADLKGDYFRGERLMRELELRFGREHTIGKHYTIENGRVIKVWPNHDDIRADERTFQSLVMGEPREAISALLNDPRANWAALNATLSRYDLQYRLYRDRSGKIVGGQIVDVAAPEDKHVSASRVDRRLSYRRLIKDKRFGPIPDVDDTAMRFSTSRFGRFDHYVAEAMGSLRKTADATKTWEQFAEVLARAGLRYSWAAGKGARIHDLDDDSRTVTPTTLDKSFRWLRYTELKARFGDFRGTGRTFNDSMNGQAAEPKRAAHAAAATHAPSESVNFEPSNRGDAGHSTWSDRAEKQTFEDKRQVRSKRVATDPSEILEELTRHEAVFTFDELVGALEDATIDDEDLRSAVRASKAKLFPIKGYGEELFTTIALREEELALDRNLATLAKATRKPVRVDAKHLVGLDADQEKLVREAASGARLIFGRGAAGAGKSYALGRVKAVFADSGFDVVGCSLAGIAAERLEQDTGIASVSNAALLYRVGIDPATLGPNTVLVIDEANLTGTRQGNAIFSAAIERSVRAVISVGDEGQLRAVEAGDAFRRYTQLYPDRVVELGTARRQISPRDRSATEAFFQRRFRTGVEAHIAGDTFKQCNDAEDLREQLIAAWDVLTQAEPNALVWVQSGRNKVVDELNAHAHAKRHARGELVDDAVVRITLRRNDKVYRSTRDFAIGERLRFGKNEILRNALSGAKVQVKNGSLGTLEKMDVVDGNARALRVRLDSGAVVDVVLDKYNWIDYGYAGTDYKGEGLTAKHTLWAVGKYDNAHNSTVGLTRHTHSVSAFYNVRDFESETDLIERLSAPNYKRTSLQFDIPEPEAPSPATPQRSASIDVEKRFATMLRERGLAPIAREEYDRKFAHRTGIVINRVENGGRTHLLLEFGKEGRAAHVDVPNSQSRGLDIGKSVVRAADGTFAIAKSVRGPRLDL